MYTDSKILKLAQSSAEVQRAISERSKEISRSWELLSQREHWGHALGMAHDPTKVEELVSVHCDECGGPLDQGPKRLLGRRQVFDIPVIEPEVVEYRQYGTVCDYGHFQKADYPREVINHVQYGKNI